VPARGIEFVSEIGEQLIRAIDDYQANKHVVMVALRRSASDAVMIIVLGVETREQIADMLRSAMNEIVTRSVQEYPGERFETMTRTIGDCAPIWRAICSVTRRPTWNRRLGVTGRG
jgi:predicted aldo/keto reductase-like oxidoreductase